MDNSPEEVPPTTRRKTQEVDCGVDHRSVAVYQAVAHRMQDFLNKSEVMKVDAQELQFHVLAPNEANIDIKHIVMQARGERRQRLFHAFSKQGANEILVASAARRDEHQIMLIILEQKSQELCQAIKQVSERHDLLAAQMERMKTLQKDVPDKFQQLGSSDAWDWER